MMRTEPLPSSVLGQPWRQAAWRILSTTEHHGGTLLDQLGAVGLVRYSADGAAEDVHWADLDTAPDRLDGHLTESGRSTLNLAVALTHLPELAAIDAGNAVAVARALHHTASDIASP